MVPTMAQDGYVIDVDEVRKAITPRTRAILWLRLRTLQGLYKPQKRRCAR